MSSPSNDLIPIKLLAGRNRIAIRNARASTLPLVSCQLVPAPIMMKSFFNLFPHPRSTHTLTVFRRWFGGKTNAQPPNCSKMARLEYVLMNFIIVPNKQIWGEPILRWKIQRLWCWWYFPFIIVKNRGKSENYLFLSCSVCFI